MTPEEKAKQQRYYEGLLEHHRKINEAYKQPLISGRAFLIILAVFALLLLAILKGWLPNN